MTKVERMAAQLAAIGHPVRLGILRFVVPAGAEGRSAGEIQAKFEIAASTLSHHLKRLVSAGVLSPRLEGTFHFYSANYPVLSTLTDYLWEDCCKAGKASGSTRCC